jgi:hypothetical protein
MTYDQALRAFMLDLVRIVREINEQQRSYARMVALMPEVKL